MAPVASKPAEAAAAPPLPALPANDSVAHAIAGAGGGILSTVVTYPLITLSTRAQVESRRADSSFLAAVERIVAREGVAGLYAGLSSAVFGIGLTNFVYYYWYEWTRAFFARAQAARGGSRRAAGQLTTVESMIAGALAGSATVILTNPIWVVNTRMTTRRGAGGSGGGRADAASKAKAEAAAAAAAANDTADGSSIVLVPEEKKDKGKEKEEEEDNTAATKPPPASTIGTLLALLRDEGPQALFAGVVPALVLVINPILQYTLFEQLKNALQARQRRSGGSATSITPGAAFVLGAISKLFATGITYPYITVKSRMHVATTQAGGVTAALRRVVRDEGYGGLYKGIGPKITQSVLTAAFLFALKDVLYAQTVRLRSRVKA